MLAAIHSAKVSKIPGAMSRSDLRPAGRNLCARTSASRSTKLAIAKRPVERVKTRREGRTATQIKGARQRGKQASEARMRQRK